ncbi:hypothetical protein MNBD_BACTEROID06-1698, partial [hydrothermal vent metagenome]
LREITFFKFSSNFATIFELYHVIIPVFIKYPPKATGKKLLLETAISKSLRIFWVLIGLIITILIIAGGVLRR